MNHSTISTSLSAIPVLRDVFDLIVLLVPEFLNLLAAVRRFRREAVTPHRTWAFENDLAAIMREFARITVQHEFNRIEPQQGDGCPLRLRFAGDVFRRRPKSPKRIGTLFGEINLHRYVYQAVEPGEPALAPLEKQLGIEVGLATPALAERVGLWSVDHEQEQVRCVLLREHNVSWSVHSLRKVTRALRDGLASFREPAQVQRLLEMLEKAFASQGKHRPTLAMGRDGVHVPIRKPKGDAVPIPVGKTKGDSVPAAMRKADYHEASTASVSVNDRRGKRVGTVYLGQMPETGQVTLSAQLTALLKEVLTQWQAQGKPVPRLAYITDGGSHPREYYQKVLRHMADPWHRGGCLQWQWVLDFWHACGYVSQLAEVLFGASATAAQWFRKWRHWLRDRHQGVTQVLRSAMWHYNNTSRFTKSQREDYWQAYRYLRKHSVWMKYTRYRSQGMPIGSGVTEAACKIVFSERLKRSGMTWRPTGGQVIVDLRVLKLSKVWQEAHSAYLRSRPLPTVVESASQSLLNGRVLKKAA